MLQEVFLESYEGIPVKTKYRLKQDFFISFQRKIIFPRRLKKKVDFQLEKGQNLIQKNNSDRNMILKSRSLSQNIFFPNFHDKKLRKKILF